jgi:hypothetical protein
MEKATEMHHDTNKKFSYVMCIFAAAFVILILWLFGVF